MPRLTVLDLRGDHSDPRVRLPRPRVDLSAARDAVDEVIATVVADGDAGLRALTSRFDGHDLDDLVVPAEVRRAALDGLAPELRAALERAIDQVRWFHERARPADWEDERARILGDDSKRRPDGAIEVRVCDPDDPDPSVKLPPNRRVWMRPRGPMPDDPLLHAAVLVYATDRTLLGTAARPHGLPWGRRIGASLDHSVWLHHPPKFDDWVLYASESPVAHAARGLIFGAMYDRADRCIVSVAQEGLIRTPRERG